MDGVYSGFGKEGVSSLPVIWIAFKPQAKALTAVCMILYRSFQRPICTGYQLPVVQPCVSVVSDVTKLRRVGILAETGGIEVCICICDGVVGLEREGG